MLAIGTVTVLAIWLAFVWFGDPDGYRKIRKDRPEAVRGKRT